MKIEMKKDKQKKKFKKLLRKYAKNREVVKLYRTVTEGEANIYGIIHKVTSAYLHLSEIYEFKFNGEIIIPNNHFDSIRRCSFEKTTKKILKAEDQLNKIKPKRTKLNLTDWAAILKGLQKKNIDVIIECEDLLEPTFTIGSIAKVNDKKVKIWYYDPNGKIDKKTTKVRFKDITLLRFKDQYSTIFKKYKTKC